MSEPERCPKCGSLNLNYETLVDDGALDGQIYYPFECGECGFEGKEWYYLKFDTMTDTEGEKV